MLVAVKASAIDCHAQTHESTVPGAQKQSEVLRVTGRESKAERQKQTIIREVFIQCGNSVSQRSCIGFCVLSVFAVAVLEKLPGLSPGRCNPRQQHLINTMNGLHPPSEALAGASEGVLAKLTSLYAGAGPGSLGLKHIADDLGLQREVRKPRRKIRCAAQQTGHSQRSGATERRQHSARNPRLFMLLCSVMIVGNHSAGKSSFINWYIGERVVKTGVAIETRGFILCTSGRCSAVCHMRRHSKSRLTQQTGSARCIHLSQLS